MKASLIKEQLNYFKDFKKEFRENMADVNRYLSQLIKDLSDTLKEDQVPPVLQPEAEEFPEKNDFFFKRGIAPWA